MPQWTVISKRQHAQARYQPRQGYRHAAGQLVTPVLLAELPKLVTQFVLGFMPQQEGISAVVLLGVEDGHTLYLAPDGRWLGSYVPASLRGYPFTLLPDDQGQTVLCIDADHLTADPAQGERLFDEDGQPAEAVARQLEFQRQCAADRRRTQQAAQALQRAGVLEPWTLEVPRGEGEGVQRIDGLLRVNEKALNTLEADTYASLQGAPMALAHAHLFSVHQVGQLTERLRWHEQGRQQKASAPGLEEMFGDDDDELTFDFGE